MNAVIIVAGGKGLRMGGDIPKQFLPVGGKPILMRTIDRFLQYDEKMQVVLVLPESQQEYWRTLCDEYHFSQPYTLANGGETRFHSVKNGLALVSPDAQLIGVHDGVRPFVSLDTIRATYEEAARSEAVVPVIEVVETVRHLVDGKSVTVPRSDASVVERFGHPVTLVPGNRENIKITTPFDLTIAAALCNDR